MIDGELIAVLERIAVALERLAGPAEEVREAPRPATLTTAIYSREERERKELRERLKASGSPRNPSSTAGPHS